MKARRRRNYSHPLRLCVVRRSTDAAGNRIYGHVAVHCPTCQRARGYVGQVVQGQDGAVHRAGIVYEVRCDGRKISQFPVLSEKYRSSMGAGFASKDRPLSDAENDAWLDNLSRLGPDEIRALSRLLAAGVTVTGLLETFHDLSQYVGGDPLAGADHPAGRARALLNRLDGGA